MEEEKSVKCIVLDAGPLILNEPSVSSLLAKSEELYTTQSVLAEIRDPSARQRVQTTVIPFLKVRNPGPASVKIISDFARKTGDLSVLSRTDLEVIALAYELECERNGGDWRLRKVPGQKTLNGSPPGPEPKAEEETGEANGDSTAPDREASNKVAVPSEGTVDDVTAPSRGATESTTVEGASTTGQVDAKIAESIENLQLEDGTTIPEQPDASPSDDSDGDWITPENIDARLAADISLTDGSASSKGKAPVILQVGTVTGDFALQNVLLQMNLNLLSCSSALARVRQARSHVLRCHACFAVHRGAAEQARQFCSRCGQPALTRVACSARADDGSFTLHLKRNFQHNRRGDRYSIPKPAAGSASGRNVKGGGKNGWGHGLILAEDQKEYVAAMRVQNRKGAAGKAFVDDDYLPGILTGKRDKGPGGRPKVGAGRNVNSKKR